MGAPPSLDQAKTMHRNTCQSLGENVGIGHGRMDHFGVDGAWVN